MVSNLKEQLDIPYADLLGNLTSLRGFIIDAENDFDLEAKEIDSMSEEELQAYVEFLDNLYT